MSAATRAVTGRRGPTAARTAVHVPRDHARSVRGGEVYPRFYDAILKVDDVEFYHEVKTGIGNLSSRQRRADAAMVANNEEVVYIFLVSAKTGRIGPPPWVLRALRDDGIPYEIWLPGV